MRLGIFGGTFDPIHLGHLIVAQETLDFFKFDKLLFIPAKLPPHKPDQKISDSSHRLRMVELAIKNNPGFAIDDLEINRKGPSFTVDTVINLQSKGELYLIMGDDSFRDIETWDRFEQLFLMAKIIVVSRPGENRLKQMKFNDFVKEQIANSMIEIRSRERLSGKIFSDDWNIACFEIPRVGISSTEIRRRVESGHSIRYLVNDRVRQFICEQNLYTAGE